MPCMELVEPLEILFWGLTDIDFQGSQESGVGDLVSRPSTEARGIQS